MPIMVSGFSKPKFPPAPEGLHAGVCCDVIELGLIRSSYTDEMVDSVRIVWQLAALRSDGKPYEVSKKYRRSLHEKAGLRKHLQSWRGRKFTQDEIRGFDLESILSVPAFLNVVHGDPSEDGTVWANVDSVMKLPPGMEAPQVRSYVRKCDRKDDRSSPVPPPGFEDGPDPAPSITDDDVPF